MRPGNACKQFRKLAPIHLEDQLLICLDRVIFSEALYKPASVLNPDTDLLLCSASVLFMLAPSSRIFLHDLSYVCT